MGDFLREIIKRLGEKAAMPPRPRLAGTGAHAVALLAGVVHQAPTSSAASALGGARDRALCPVATNY